MEPSQSASAVAKLLAEHYAATGPPIMAELAAVVRSAQTFFPDLEDWAVFLNVLTRAQASPEFAQLSRPALLSRAVPVIPGLGTNVRSVADASGIPRETVRRKVHRLVERGYLEWRDSRLYPTAFAMEQLDPLRMQIYASVAKIWLIVERTRNSSGPSLDPC
ncbi:helix-turn-helix domain-containing protein [Phenylobacterium deserti]|uniref:HTH iclR-type domain-containing protein n=1 Tax=Phenylobacterium deserti TaxID=1914756 RepID=A0A328ACY7_9CAUL|nr:helix-turn-helix domain-containing protein [Phenylobacterium deserti]RAK52683.1 hypothetical protein DJ018_10825 [Phenylobacterium deserti]